jgi:hypothetical protein
VERCIGCQYYDRGKNRATDQGVLRWGQCRRSAPVLSPVNAKVSMIEGVWPTIRDDDWCGEWKAAARLPMRRAADAVLDAAAAIARPAVANVRDMVPTPAHLVPASGEALASTSAAAAACGDD